MNKNDLVAAVADSSGLSKNDATKAVDSLFDCITDELKSGGDVRLVGFGTFSVAKPRGFRRSKPADWRNDSNRGLEAAEV